MCFFHWKSKTANIFDRLVGGPTSFTPCFPGVSVSFSGHHHPKGTTLSFKGGKDFQGFNEGK